MYGLQAETGAAAVVVCEGREASRDVLQQPQVALSNLLDRSPHVTAMHKFVQHFALQSPGRAIIL